MRVAIATACLVALLLFASAVRAAAPPPSSQPATEDPKPAWTMVARWYGRLTAYDHSYATREPGAFGMALSRPNSKQTSEAAVVVREEVSNYGGTRAVVESISWSSAVRDLYYLNKDGSRVGAGTGGRGGGTLTGDDLTEPADVPADAVRDAEERIEQARQQLREAEQRMAEAKQQAPQPQDAAAKKLADEEVVKAHRAAAREYQVIASRPDVAAADLERAQAKRDKAAEAFNAWVTAESERLAAAYSKSLESKLKRLQDPATPDAERDKLGKEIAAAGEKLSADMKQFSDLSDAIVNEQQQHDVARQVEDARRQLLAALGNLEELQAPRPKATVHIDVPERPDDDGKRTVTFGFALNDPKEMTQFPVDVIPLKLVGFTSVLEKDYKPETWSAGRVVRFRGQAELKGGLDDQPITVSENESRQGGEPGLVGGGESRFDGTFTRVPVKQQLVVRGKVLHRVRVPRDEHDVNLLLPEPPGPPSAAPGSPSPLEGAIPAAGPVLIEAWTLDPQELGTAAAATRPPDLATTTQGGDGSFEFGVPKAKDKVLRLRFTWHNADARLWEMQTLDVNTNDVLAKSIGSSAASAAPVPDIDRARTVWFRFGGPPMEYPLGAERRGAAVHRDGDVTTLRFEGLNSILVNTFVLKAPYLNQNNQAFTLTNVHVPAARLVGAAPSFIDAAKVRARLGVPAAGEVPRETSTDVKVRGSVVCFPTCLTMALGGMGIVSLPDDGKQSDEVGKLAQGIYEYWADRTRNSVVAIHPEPPWVFPFPSSPDVANAMAAEAEQKAASTDPVDRALAPGLRDKARALYPPKWPYVDADDSHLSKQWLISLGGERYTFLATTTGDEEFVGGVALAQWELYRPWQTVEVVKPYFKDVHKVGSKVYDGADVFSRPRAGAVLRTLGRGAFSVISIDHLDSNGGKGGHILLLLGAITDNDGFPVRLIVHDPYGDQSQNPGVQGYYAPGYNDDKRLYDKDRSGGNHGTRGRYAPYGPEINSYGGRMYSKWWLAFDPPEQKPAVADVRKRLLPSQKWTGGNPPAR